jgi:hypothetical protein
MPKSPTVNVRMAPDLLERVDAAAAAAGVNRSEWIKAAAERYLSHTDPAPTPKLPTRPRVKALLKPGSHAGCLRVGDPDAYCRGCVL